MPRLARCRASRKNEYLLVRSCSTAHVRSLLPSSTTMTSYEHEEDANAAAACSMNSGRFSASLFAGTSTETSAAALGAGRWALPRWALGVGRWALGVNSLTYG